MIPEAAVDTALDVFLDAMDTIPTALVRAALEAAAPLLMATAWDEGAAYMSDGWSSEQEANPNPYKARRVSKSTTEIPEAAVEAAHRAICEDDLDDCLEWRGRCVKALEAATPHIFEQGYKDGVQATRDALLAFAEDRDKALGSIRSHITTYELRKLLGVADD